MRISLQRSMLAFAFFAALLSALPALAQADDHFQRSFSVQPGATLAVTNYKGLIRVTASENSQVVVDVQKKFEGSAKDRAWWMPNTRVDFSNSSDRVEVSVVYPNCNCSPAEWVEHDEYQAAVELTIQVPRNMNVSLQGQKPDIDVSGINGDLDITSGKSAIEVRSTTGAIHIDTQKNTVHLKEVNIRGALQLRMEKGEASIEARNLGDRVSLETEKGAIILKAPENAGMNLDYSGSKRSIFHSDFNIAAEAGSGIAVRGTINGGGTQVRIRTERGSISLEKL
jgi:hypothetical protein